MDILKNIKRYSKEDKVAAIVEDQILTYEELETKSNSLANYMLDKYKEDRTPIVIYGNKENDILIAMIAALKSGRAYIPIDITFPEDRINKILQEVNPKVIINCTTENVDIIPYSISYIELEKVYGSYSTEGIEEKFWVKGDDNCYILFTSGSTGQPKGVQISKNNIDSFVKWFSKFLNVDNDNNAILNQPSYSFDLSVMPIYLGLTNGKILFSLSYNTLENTKYTFEELKKSDMQLWISTPAFATLCVQDDTFTHELMPNLKTMYFIGEVLPPMLVNELKLRFPNIRIINSYGPTEATVAVTGIDITDEVLYENKELPIGKVMEGAYIKIVNENGMNLRDGEKGEIVIIGRSVSKGYYKNDDITNKVFFYKDMDGEILRGYKSGDIGYFKEDILYFSGRKDFQIKLNGFRIELEDIENNIRKLDNIKNAVVLPCYKEGKIAHLVAFVTLKTNNKLSPLKNTLMIKSELKKYIPKYMIPRNIKVISEFPLNANGKIDRRRLMEEIK
ncbi:D-alanine--poly(phosphoribitol) ligase subunit DltA [Clostridium sulfidigenes]|uniref:D-alanine--poly(phosphoribitol) ligase subunit DltA n=1 Tax=Clostridium sulfidigenes TaxID=318464 RepID=UPI003F8A45EE